MNFSKEYLAELESPTRIFRNNIDRCMSPTKSRVKDSFLTGMFLDKREIFELDEYPTMSTCIKSNFFTDERSRSKHKIIKPFNLETREMSQQINGPSPQTIRETPAPFPVKFKQAQTKNETSKNENGKEFKETIEKGFLSDDEQFKSEAEPIFNIRTKSTNTHFPNAIEQPAIDMSNNRYEKYIQQRKSVGIVDKNLKRKKTSTKFLDKSQLRTRILKISTFWRGKNCFIPSAFKVIKLNDSSDKVFIEYQDFSLKGLSHITDNFGETGSQFKLSSQLDTLGHQNLHNIGGILEHSSTL